MSTATAILKSRLHPILTKVEAKLQEVWDGILIIRVDGHPLGALGGGVDCVEADGDFALGGGGLCPARGSAPGRFSFPWAGSSNAGHFPGGVGWTGGCKPDG
jgi:hypothetical protein